MAQQRAAAAGRYVSPPLWRGCGSLCVCGRVQEPAPLWARGGSLATVPRARGRSDRPWRRRASPMGRARLRRGRLRLKSASRRGESPSPGVARGCVPSGARLQPAPLVRAAHMRRRPAFGQDVLALPARTAAKVAGFPGPQGRDHPPSPRSNGALSQGPPALPSLKHGSSRAAVEPG